MPVSEKLYHPVWPLHVIVYFPSLWLGGILVLTQGLIKTPDPIIMSSEINGLELLDLRQKLNERQAGKKNGSWAGGGSSERVNNAKKLYPILQNHNWFCPNLSENNIVYQRCDEKDLWLSCDSSLSNNLIWKIMELAIFVYKYKCKNCVNVHTLF